MQFYIITIIVYFLKYLHILQQYIFYKDIKISGSRVLLLNALFFSPFHLYFSSPVKIDFYTETPYKFNF